LGKITAQPNVIAVPFFISDGLHSYEDIPVLLWHRERVAGAISVNASEVFHRNPYALRGRRLYYASAIGTEPLFADVILEQVAAFDAQHAATELMPA
jgi:sirohydrochlorin cobaltochelatase